MSQSIPVYLATVCLEPNRWSSRKPSFAVSDWLARIADDGFAGIELWENHACLAADDEQARLTERATPLAVYNTYATFGDDPAEREHRASAAAAINRLNAGGVKYNLGRDADQIDAYRRNLFEWAGQLPENCRLLCEWHPGTVIEELDAAVAFFADLDPSRFAVIAHLSDDDAALDRVLTGFGARAQHLHLQRNKPECDPATEAGRASMTACVAVLNKHGFSGSATIEFTRGIGKGEQIETVYANALADLRALQES